MTNGPLKSDTIKVGDNFVATLERVADPAARSVVFLHGIGSRASSFASLLGTMTQSQSVLAWDAPGYGNSTAFLEDWPVALDYATRLRDLLDARAMQRPVDLVGHSLGCLMAAAFARAYPDRVRKLVLMAPALGYRVPPDGNMPDAVAARIIDMETHGPARMADLRAERLVDEPAGKPAIVAAVRRAMASVTMPGYAQAVRMLASGDLLADLDDIAVPVLVLTGANDRVTPPAGAERARDVLAARPFRRGAADRYIAIAAAGHAVYLEAQIEVVAALQSFLETSP